MLIEIETKIPAEPSVVFALHESPGAFARLMPPWERIEQLAGDGIVPLGGRTALRIWVGKIPLRWDFERTEYEPGRRFADRQIRGPFEHWYHRQIFFEDGGGTLMRDELEYALPFGSLGRKWAGQAVWRRLWKLFEFRHEATRRIVEAREVQNPEPVHHASDWIPAVDVQHDLLERSMEASPGAQGGQYSAAAWKP